MGRGRAAGLESELSDFGSVIWRVSGPEDCAKQGALMERTSTEMNVVRSEFIVTSAEERDELRPSKQQAELYTRKAWRLHKRGIATGIATLFSVGCFRAQLAAPYRRCEQAR